MRTIIFLVVLSVAGCFEAIAADMSTFSYQADIKGNSWKNTPVALRLPSDVIFRTGSSLNDLRIFDETGHETPYVIYPSRRPQQTEESFSWEITGYDKSGNLREIMLKRPKGIGAFRDIELITPDTDFMKQIEVYAFKNGQFQQVGTGMVYDFSKEVRLRNTTIKTAIIDADVIKIVIDEKNPAPKHESENMSLKYKDLEFTASSLKKGDIRIEGLTSHVPAVTEGKTDYDRKTYDSPVIKRDKADNSDIDLGLLNLPIERVSFDIRTPYFYREVELWSSETNEKNSYMLKARDVIYRIPGVRDAKLSAYFSHSRCRYAMLKVIDQDNSELDISSLNVEWASLMLYFIPVQGQRYTLYFGAKGVDAPHYEMNLLVPDRYDVLSSYEKVSLGPVTENSRFKEKDLFTWSGLQKYLITCLAIIVAIILGFWIYRLSRNIPKDNG
jgi:hypothetical protein